MTVGGGIWFGLVLVDPDEVLELCDPVCNEDTQVHEIILRRQRCGWGRGTPRQCPRKSDSQQWRVTQNVDGGSRALNRDSSWGRCSNGQADIA
jgi:hypothetical protein